jgi:predicted regulator of Ras-like GTPase activity (Roadblock/LC7/MglB family)
VTSAALRTGDIESLGWLLNNLVSRVPEITDAIVLSTDGLLLASSVGLTRDDAERLAAVASGFQSLARGTGEHFGRGAIRQTIVEMERGFLFVTAASTGGCLAVLSAERSDVGLVAYEMALLVARVGEFVSPSPRGPLSGPDLDPGRVDR